MFESPNWSVAGAAGIEPALAVLETVVLPLYDAPKALSIIDNYLLDNKLFIAL